LQNQEKLVNKLWVRYSLTLGFVTVVATILPILVLYELSAAGLIETSYEIDPRVRYWDIRRGRFEAELDPSPEAISANARILKEATTIDPRTGRETIERELPRDLVIISSEVFHFRIELPAKIAIGGVLAASLLIGILLSVLLSSSITSPVNKLAQATREIGSHNLKARVDTKGSQELTDLAQSFNRMAEELEQAELRRRNLMADVAHELRTPLSVLDGNLRALLDGIHMMDEREIALLLEQTQHLNRLVKDLHELSLAEASELVLKLRAVDLGQVIGETAAHFAPLAEEKDIELILELEGDLHHPQLDSQRIRQVLHNLLSNAIRHTPHQGKIKINAIKIEEEYYNTILFTIQDNGDGISPEDIVHIFDRFHRTIKPSDQNTDSTGLGLSIAKAIIEAHGGDIQAYSEGKDQGSKFSFLLPYQAV
jgi:signal transduction histidine kinase